MIAKQIKENPEINSTLNIDVDINLEALKKEGITEKEIDKLFEIDKDSTVKGKTKEKQRQENLDNDMVTKFLEEPSHENFNKIWERYYFGIKGYAFKFLKDWELADDMVSQTFMRAWEYKKKYDRTKAKFSTWLYIICRNLCLGEINARKKDNLIPNDISNMYDSTLLKSSIGLTNDSAQFMIKNNVLEKNSLDDLTYKLYNTSINELEKLGPVYSNILKMKLVQELKIREIADILHMNESTVKNYLYKGKEMLEKIIKKKYKTLYEMYMESANVEAQKIY